MSTVPALALDNAGMGSQAPRPLDAGERAVLDQLLRAHRRVLGAVARGDVRLAPAHVEDLADRVGMGLTAWAVRTGKRGAVGQMIRHGPSRDAIADTRLGPATNPLAFAI